MRKPTISALVIRELRGQLDPLVCREILKELSISKARLNEIARRSTIAAIEERWPPS
jgi:hypothetical protein